MLELSLRWINSPLPSSSRPTASIIFEDRVGFEPTVVFRHWINSPDFSASKATHPFSSLYGIRTHILGLEDRCPIQLDEETIQQYCSSGGIRTHTIITDQRILSPSRAPSFATEPYSLSRPSLATAEKLERAKTT